MSLEYCINETLRLDYNYSQLLQPLMGKTISVCCTDFAQQIKFISFADNMLHINSTTKEIVSCAISGPLIGLLTLAIQKQQADFRTCNITITGDTEVAEHVQNFLFKLDLDWEEAWSKYVGDVVAHRAIYTLKQLRQQQKHTHSSLEEMISEYLREDSGLVPTHCEVANFMHEVDTLRMDVDRLEARINAHENN